MEPESDRSTDGTNQRGQRLAVGVLLILAEQEAALPAPGPGRVVGALRQLPGQPQRHQVAEVRVLGERAGQRLNAVGGVLEELEDMPHRVSPAHRRAPFCTRWRRSTASVCWTLATHW